MICNCPNISGLLKAGAKRKGLFIAAVAVSLLLYSAVAAWKAIPPMYSSWCSIKFSPPRVKEGLVGRLLSTSPDEIETQRAIILSHNFLMHAAAELSLVKSPAAEADLNRAIEYLRSCISVEREGKTDILRISATAKEPGQALRLVQALSAAFLASYKEKHNRRFDEVISHINEEQQAANEKLKAGKERLEKFIRENRLVSIDLEGEALVSQKLELEGKARKNATGIRPELTEVNENIDLHMDKKIELDRLKAEVESLRNIASYLEKKRQEAMIWKAEEVDDARIITPAQLPGQAFNKPDYFRTVLTGLTAGILLGLILTTIMGAMDNSVALIEKLEKQLRIRVLGIIPCADPKESAYDVSEKGKNGAGLAQQQVVALVTQLAPNTIISESFRGLRANIQAAIHDGEIKTIAVTASCLAQGSTTVAANLSISLAQAGLNTLLVATDITKSDLAARFFLDESPGLTDILLGTLPWEETVKTITEMIIGGMTLDRVISTPGLDKLNIITAGALPDKPGELLVGSKEFSEFLDTARNAYDIVILDSSPVLSNAEAAFLSARADRTIIVYNPCLISIGVLKRTLAQLSRMSSNIMGITLNCVRPSLVPHALREKYAEARADKGASTLRSPVKKGGYAKVLIPVFIIIIAVALWWQRDWVFSKRAVPGLIKGVKPPEISTEEKPAILVLPEDGPVGAELPGTATPMKKPAMEAAVPEAVEEKQPWTGLTHPPAAVETGRKFNYQEGRFPYSVYLGSFNTTEQVRRAVDHYTNSGLVPYWVKVNLGEKGIWYRVYSGEFANKDNAEAYISEKEIEDGEVKKTPYAVYIESFTDRKALETEMTTLRHNSYSTYIISDEDYNSLFTGVFITKRGAEELSAELTDLGISNRVVLR